MQTASPTVALSAHKILKGDPLNPRRLSRGSENNAVMGLVKNWLKLTPYWDGYSELAETFFCLIKRGRGRVLTKNRMG